MHFAIDQEPSPKAAKAALPEKPVEDPRAAQDAKLASDMLFASTPVRLAGQPKNRDRVEVILKDLYRENNRVYVRYAIQNRGRATYSAGTPGVFTLRSPRSSSSLYALSQSQLVGDGIRITSQGQAPVKVLNAEVRGNAVAPGGTAWGLVEFELPSRADGPSVVAHSVGWRGRSERDACPMTAMERDIEITAARVLRVWRSTTGPEIPPECDGMETVCATQIVEAFRIRFRKACDVGVCQRFSNALLEPANPFAARLHRHVRQEAIILGTLILAALGLAVYFNLSAVVR